jgi:hypothetical protein
MNELTCMIVTAPADDMSIAEALRTTLAGRQVNVMLRPTGAALTVVLWGEAGAELDHMVALAELALRRFGIVVEVNPKSLSRVYAHVIVDCGSGAHRVQVPCEWNEALISLRLNWSGPLDDPALMKTLQVELEPGANVPELEILSEPRGSATLRYKRRRFKIHIPVPSEVTGTVLGGSDSGAAVSAARTTVRKVDDIVRNSEAIPDEAVHFSATAPSLFKLSETLIVDIWLHTAAQREEVAKRAPISAGVPVSMQMRGAANLTRGSRVDIRLQSEHLTVLDGSGSAVWEGIPVSVGFPVECPSNPKRVCLLTATFSVEGFEIARLHLTLRPELPSEPECTVERIERAFASHSSADNQEVLSRIQGMQSVAPWLHVFYDTADLHSGRFEPQLWRAIEDSERLYLFWSPSASKSVWVEKEWRHALSKKGLDFITPVPLASPQLVPPPQELQALYFNSWTLVGINSEAHIRHSKTTPP